MKVCFPVESDMALESRVYGHFGSAPMFILVDTETSECRALANGNIKHEHGKCSPFKALGGQTVDAVVVGGIGGGAMGKLRNMGAEVFKASAATIKENLDHLRKGELVRFGAEHICGGHGHDGGCSHH